MALKVLSFDAVNAHREIGKSFPPVCLSADRSLSLYSIRELPVEPTKSFRKLPTGWPVLQAFNRWGAILWTN